MKHIPVMANEIINFIYLDDETIIVDCTLGAGGHSKKIFDIFGKKITMYYGLDKDREMLEIAKQTLNENELVTYIHSDYNDISEIIQTKKLYGRVNTFVFDLGVSSVHFDTPERGFSYRFDSRLDMRLNRDDGKDAVYVVNSYREEQLADLIYKYGEERHSRRIARNIIEYRKKKKIETTKELAEIILKSVPFIRDKNKKENHSHPAVKTFQAIRIEVNDELTKLDTTLRDCALALKKCGSLCVISFHSLEDRIVKNVFRHLKVTEYNNPEKSTEKYQFEIMTGKPITPTDNETSDNPRSRSAKLRVLRRIN